MASAVEYPPDLPISSFPQLPGVLAADSTVEFLSRLNPWSKKVTSSKGIASSKNRQYQYLLNVGVQKLISLPEFRATLNGHPRSSVPIRLMRAFVWTVLDFNFSFFSILFPYIPIILLCGNLHLSTCFPLNMT